MEHNMNSTSLTSYLDKNALPEISDEQMMAALADTTEEQRTGSGSSVTYLSFSGKTGSYALGRDRTDVTDDVLWILEPKSVIEGWICWKGGKPVDRVEWSTYNKAAAVDEVDLKDHGPYNTKTGEGWQRALGFGCISTDGAATSVQFITNSVSGRNAISDLLAELVRRMTSGSPSLPIFGFGAESFTAQGATNYKPKFLIPGWATRAEVAAFLAGEISLDELVYGDNPPATPTKRAPNARR
jgi:hypothetical protein